MVARDDRRLGDLWTYPLSFSLLLPPSTKISLKLSRFSSFKSRSPRVLVVFSASQDPRSCEDEEASRTDSLSKSIVWWNLRHLVKVMINCRLVNIAMRRRFWAFLNFLRLNCTLGISLCNLGNLQHLFDFRIATTSWILGVMAEGSHSHGKIFSLQSNSLYASHVHERWSE